MSDRRNRVLAIVLGLILFLGGGAVLLCSVGVLGAAASNKALVNRTMVHWWHEHGSWSFVVLGVVGLVLLALGLALATKEWRRNDGKTRMGTVVLPSADHTRGHTTLRAPALSHSLEEDLSRIPDVGKALVGLFGTAPRVEMRSVLQVGDDAELTSLADEVESVLARAESSVGFRPDPVQVTVRFSGAPSERHLQ